ncbi:MAG: transposase [Patescibacteria group bacterium]
MPKIKNHAPEEYYHIYNRGMQKQPIFETDKDRLRFLFLLLVFQGKNSIKNISREIKQNVQSSTLHINPELEKDILQNRTVELISFCLMLNHFHLQVLEKTEGGISKYMQRVLTAYTKYFNVKYQRSGHLLQGSYKSVLIEDDLQLMHVSVYIHKNPNELKGWKGKEDKYPWSSFQDYISLNRFGKLLSTGIVLDRYDNNKKAILYRNFVETSPAKEEL